jgi:hypothetical protein
VTFSELYDAIVAQGALPQNAARVSAMRRAFEGRTGRIEAGPDEGGAPAPGRSSDRQSEDFEARARAFWDDALTHQGFALEVGRSVIASAASPGSMDDAEGWVRGLACAHRGLFVPLPAEDRLVLSDLWGGGQFVVDELDPASRDAMDAAAAPFDARLVANASTAIVALLPGAIYHPAGTMEPIATVLAAARERGMQTLAVLDALLRMEQSLRTLSRVKAAYAYRPQALLGSGQTAAAGAKTAR